MAVIKKSITADSENERRKKMAEQNGKLQRNKSVLVRISLDEMKKIEKKASKFTNGNVSDWIRYASINMEPNVDDRS